jgi:hypothetical protein
MNDPDKAAVDDVRMRGFAHRQTVEAALAWLDAQFRPPVSEMLPLHLAAGRVLATAVVSDADVPGFDRATMDGYAVVAESTEGATSYNRLPLAVIGDSLPGHPFHGSVAVGQAVRIMTGAPVPLGCDTVLPAEWVESASAAGTAGTKAGHRRPDATNTQCVSALAALQVSRRGHHGGLDAARRGECDLAGIHLLDPVTDRYNQPFLTPALDLVAGYGRLQGVVFRPAMDVSKVGPRGKPSPPQGRIRLA